VLVLYGADDRISDPGWVSNLADEAYDGELALMPGAHTFVWSDPEAWSEPLRAFAARCLRAAAAPHPAVEP
jgi:pimeloyl-ACP methyl ester carboxylesterase